MPFNGSGQFNLLYNWQNDAAQGLNISSSRMQGQDADIASGLSDCVTKDGQTVPTANLPMGGFRHLNVANAQYPTEYATVAQIQSTGLKVLSNNGTPEWLAFSDTPTFVDGTHFTVPGNLTDRYSVGRRVRASVTAGTVYGVITNSAFGSVTTVTLSLDSGALDSGLTEVDVGILNPAHPSLPTFAHLRLAAASGDNGALTIDGTANTLTGATIALLGPGATTPNKYIRSVNGTLSFVNSAYTNQIAYLDDSGDFVAQGIIQGSNITGSSDERLKKDWQPLADDFLDRLASLMCGTFAWVRGGERSVGVPAQALREFLPEAIREDKDGYLSVAYGNAALVACAILAKEVRRLRAIVDQK